MNTIVEFLFNLGLMFGGLVGVVLALLLHWAVPGLSPAFGALLLVLSCAVGVVLEHASAGPTKR